MALRVSVGDYPSPSPRRAAYAYLSGMTVSSPSTPAAWVAAHAADAPPALIARVQAVLAADEGLSTLPVAEGLQ